MKTIVVYEFTRHFTRHRHQPCAVTSRGKVVGQWFPTGAPPPVNFMKRLREDFSEKLPFTGAELLKESKKR